MTESVPAVHLVKDGAFLWIEPALRIEPYIRRACSFFREKMLYGAEAKRAGIKVKREHEKLYRMVSVDGANNPCDRALTYSGLQDRLVSTLQLYGVSMMGTVKTRAFKFEPDVTPLLGLNLREGQQRMLQWMLTEERAQLDGVTGLGKTFLVKQFTRCWPNECVIGVTAPSTAICEAFYRDLYDLHGPRHVGMVGAGKNNPSRITVAVSKSLLKLPVHKLDFLLFDEVHTAGAPDVFHALTEICAVNPYVRMLGFSGSTEVRTDKSDLAVEALFGPVRERVTYEEAVEEGYMRQIETKFYRVKVHPYVGSDVYRKKKMIWRNAARNDAVVRVANWWVNRFIDHEWDPQVLILVGTLEHAAALHQLLPNYTIICGTKDGTRIDALKLQGLLPNDYVPMTSKETTQAIEDFEKGKIRRVIGTSTLGTGVDMRHLDLLIRADGGSSEVTNIQFRGRATRGERAVYLDFMIEGDDSENRKSKKRFKSAEDAGWKPEILSLP